MRIFLFTVFLFTTLTSQADIVFAPAITYSKTSVDNNGTTTESDSRSIDLRLGYIHQSGLYLGGMYALAKIGDDSATAAGPTVGFNHRTGFFLLFTYFLSSEYKFNNGGKLTDGMGPQVDVGWVFPLTSSVFLGPQVTYRSINYTKSEGSGGGSTTTDITHSSTVPYVTMWFRF